MSRTDRQTAIIGAGIVGCAVALELARRGERALVIDRLGEAGHGTTSASCGLVRRFYSTRTMTAMAEEGARVWADWRAYLRAGADEDVARFLRPGMLVIPEQIDESIEGIVAHAKELGVELQVLSPAEVAERFPYLTTASQSPVRRPDDDDFFEETGRPITGAVFEPDAGYIVSPLLATTNLRDAAEREGVEFRLGRGVTAIRARDDSGRFRLELEDGSTVEAEVVVNAAGPHSTLVNQLAGVTLPIEVRALRREVSAVQNPLHVEGIDDATPLVLDLDSGMYFRPESRGRDLAVGSLDPRCDPPEWLDDPDECDMSCSPGAHERNVMRLMKRFPDVQLGPRRGIGSLYDVTLLDWNPVLDRTDLAGFYVAMGTSGSSFKTATVIGALMAELVQACEAGRDHDADPLHITLPRTGFEVDVAFFSRLRQAHASTRTVIA